jgi:carbamoyltransferase
MLTFGISANEHDAALAVIDGSRILFASHAERYSRRKNDPHLHPDLVAEALRYGAPRQIVWYERPLLKQTRKLYAGQFDAVLRTDGAAYLRRNFGLTAPVLHVGHHASHAAASFFTSSFEEAAVVVVDAIGEWTTVSVWEGRDRELRCLWQQRYPHSVGLLYSAFTQRCGFKPNEEEYILMGLAAYGEPKYVDLIRDDLIEETRPPHFRLKTNVHRGVLWWRPDIEERAHLAASIQAICEDYLVALARWARERTGMRNIALGGGVALNCVANARIARESGFEKIWICPNPGDAGSSVGAVAALQRQALDFDNAFLGHDIQRPFDIEAAAADLAAGAAIGVANGRAEFGPRALGHRSLLCDPRGPQAKDRVNGIKQRELFRPFAPAVLEEHAAAHFDMPTPTSPYMQFVAKVHRPDLFPAITHVDGTARVQTVARKDNPTLHALLSRFHGLTGCPMLLNTSLNIKGEPLVNTWEDAQRFSALHDVRIY